MIFVRSTNNLFLNKIFDMLIGTDTHYSSPVTDEKDTADAQTLTPTENSGTTTLPSATENRTMTSSTGV